METKETPARTTEVIQSGVPRIRTYERDVGEFMKQEGGTAAKFALAEQERRINNTEQPLTSRPFLRGSTTSLPAQAGEARGEGVVSLQNPPTAPPRGLGTPPQAGGDVKISIPLPQMELMRKSARSLVLWSVVFLFLAGAIGIGYWYFSNLPAAENTPTISGMTKIILADREKTLDSSRLVRDTFITAFAREREAALALSSFTLITPTKAARSAEGEAMERALTAQEFLSLLNASTEGGFVRALEPQFALGLRGLPTNRAFLVFKTNYYQTALAGMLKWEKTILGDIGPLFGEAIGGVNFTDRTIRNRDIRELIGTDDKPLLLYGFADKKTIIITNDEDSFEKIMDKLVAAPQ